MGQLTEWCRNACTKAARALRTAKGRNVLLYLLFVCVAFTFWLLMSLDSEVQRNYDIPLQLENIPDSVTVIQDFPPSISATVKAKGSKLIRFIWAKPSPLKMPFDRLGADNGIIALSPEKVEARLRDYFGDDVTLLTSRPDSLFMSYTSGKGVRVPLVVRADISTSLQSIQSGNLRANVDSVTLYSLHPIPPSVRSVATEEIVKTDIKDTTRVNVRVVAPAGMRAIPDNVVVTIPVEPLIAKKRKVNIEAADLPKGTRMLMFPAVVEVSYLVPMSKYSDDYPIRAVVKYPEARRSRSGKVSVTLAPFAGRYYSISHSPDSVEFVIEHIAD